MKGLTHDRAAERMRAAGAEPLERYSGADTPWRCVCLTCGTVGYPRLSGMGRQGPCKPCGRKRANAKMRLNAAQSIQVMRDAGLEPLEDYPGSRAWRCRCLKCDREVTPTYGSIRSGSGCHYCASKARGVAQRGRPISSRGKLDYDPNTVVLLMRNAGMEPLEDCPGRHAPWRCRCLVCGTIGLPRLNGIQAGQGGCVPCGKRKADAAARTRRLNDDSTAAEMTAAGLNPLVPYPGSDKPWRCRCVNCDREVTARLTGVRTGKGCRYCATHGIDLTAPTMVYVVSHPQWGAVKVGIGACTGYNSRLLQHERAGWVLAHSRAYPTGAGALDVEQAVLARLRAKKLAPYLAAKTMPNGWTETCDATRVTTDTLWAIVNEESDRIGVGTVSADGPRRRPSANGLVDPLVAVEQMRTGGFEPLVPYPGRANTAWPCRCKKCGTEGRPRLNNVRNRGSGCRTCRNKAVHSAQVAAKAAEAVATMRAAGFEPLEDYAGSQRPWRCRCNNCDTESTPAYSNVRSGTSCRHCGRQPGPSTSRPRRPSRQ